MINTRSPITIQPCNDFVAGKRILQTLREKKSNRKLFGIGYLFGLTPDAWGRVSFFGAPLSVAGIDNANHPLGAGMDVKVTDLDRLLMASPMAIESLDQVKLQSEELAGVWTIGANVLLSHAVLALTQKAKSCEPRCDYFHCH
jgi:hypothetical protein